MPSKTRFGLKTAYREKPAQNGHTEKASNGHSSGTKRAHFRHKTGAILEKTETLPVIKNLILKRTDEKNPL